MAYRDPKNVAYDEMLATILSDRGELTNRQRMNRERPLPIERIGHVTRREVSLSDAGLSCLLTAEEPYDPYHNPYADEV